MTLTEDNDPQAQALRYAPIAVSSESTVVAEYVSDASSSAAYQSEAGVG